MRAVIWTFLLTLHASLCVCMFGVMQDSETPASLVIDFSVPQSWPYHTKLCDKRPALAAIAVLKL